MPAPIVHQPGAQFYERFVKGIKERIRTAQIKAALAANAELVLHYWEIGRDILANQKREGWGAKVIDFSYLAVVFITVLSPNRHSWKSLVQDAVDAKNTAGAANQNNNRKNDVRLIDPRSPRNDALCAHIIEEQEKRDKRCQPCGQSKNECNSHINFSNHNQRSESRSMREHHRVEKASIPRISVLHGEFEETSQLIRLPISVVAKQEAHSQVHASENKKPLPF